MFSVNDHLQIGPAALRRPPDDVEPRPYDRFGLSGLLHRRFTRPEYQCRFRWQPGSVVIWDNCATQHHAASDYAPQRRVMDRVSIAGDPPVGPVASPLREDVADARRG